VNDGSTRTDQADVGMLTCELSDEVVWEILNVRKRAQVGVEAVIEGGLKPMSRAIVLSCFVGLFAAPGVAAADGLLLSHTLSVASATTAAQAALSACATRGYHVAVAVSDADGQLIVLLRGDKTGPHLLDAARRKAYTAASSGARTSAWERAIATRSGVPDPNLIFLNGILAVGGGVPIRAGNDEVGAIAVSGSPGVTFDEQCADAGIAAIQADLH
jgi:uncharacterized protein GlcG (DUF336 family)